MNMVSKISKPLSSVLDIEASRHMLNRGSFMSNMFPVEWGVNADSGAVDVLEGTVVVKPLDRLRGDWPEARDASVDAKVSRTDVVLRVWF